MAPLLLTVFALAGLLVAEARESAAGKWLCKPIASAGFVWSAVVSGAAEHTVGWVMLAGFALGWLGDLLLIPKDKRAFLAGLVSFLLGHVAFVIAFLLRGVDPGLAVGSGFVLALVGAGVLRWLWPNVAPRMRGPVVAYVVVICAMVAGAVGTSLGAGPPTGPPRNLLLLGGAVAFFLSDLAVARNRFVAPGFINRAWGLPAYYGGQLLLAAASGPGLP